MSRTAVGRRLVRLACIGMLLASVPVPVWAQPRDGAPDPSAIRLRLGPVLLNPTVSLVNLGVDDNVFNEPTQQNPKSDFTFTLRPQTDAWMPIGPSWINGNITEDLVWYQEFASERGANTKAGVAWVAPLSRTSFKTSATWWDVHDRPGYEIDARARRREVKYDGLAELRVSSSTFVGVTAFRQTVDFNKDAAFDGSLLYVDLDRVSTGVGATVRYNVTSLTSLSIVGTRSRDRFVYEPSRDANSTSVNATVSFDPVALIKGSATVGYRNFEPLSADLPGYKGTTAAVNLSYTLLESTRFAVTVNRDVQYSYDIDQAYYVLTGFTGSVAQQIFGPVDVLVRGGLQSLDYQQRISAAPLPERVDRVRSYGGGVGYHFGKDLRLGFNVDRDRRSSLLAAHEYEGLRFGVSMTYGL